jgi:MFS family permease
MASLAEPASAPPRDRYELGLLIVLTLGNGVVGFDRQTVAFLAPYIVSDLNLSNAQVGWTAGALSLAIALSSLFGSQIADRTGRRRAVLIACTLLFSLLSGLSGLATTFAILLAARFALGAAEGPIVPISQTLILQSSSPERRGLNMGFMQMVGAFGIAGFLGPIVATQLADAHGWRAAMFLSIIPGLIVAGLMVVMIKPDPKRAGRPAEHHGSLFAAFGTLLKVRNMRVSLAIAGLITAWLVLQSTFLTLFLTQVKGLAPTTAGWVIGMGGWAGLIGGIGLPLLSDRIGRKPVLLFGSLAGILGPIALLALPGDPVLLAAAVLLGWLPLGIAPLYCAAVPTESVSPAVATTAVGLSMGFAELFGGVLVPPIAGQAADAFGLEAIFYICIGLALLAAFAALFLRETAPRITGTA